MLVGVLKKLSLLEVESDMLKNSLAVDVLSALLVRTLPSNGTVQEIIAAGNRCRKAIPLAGREARQR